MTNKANTSLYQHIEEAVKQHLISAKTDNYNLYEIFLSELEKPLLAAVLQHTQGNQFKSAQILGLNRGTLRTKLKQHNLL